MKQEYPKIVVFDALDTIQGYKGALPGQSKRFYQERIAQAAGMNLEEFLQKVPYDVQLWMAYFEQQKGNLEPVMLPGAEEIIRYFLRTGYQPIVVTADIPESALNTMKPFTDLGLIDPMNVYAINCLGSKKKTSTWKQAQEKHFPQGEPKVVFEDTEANLAAAMEAYHCGGYLVDNSLHNNCNHPISNFFLVQVGTFKCMKGDLQSIHHNISWDC